MKGFVRISKDFKVFSCDLIGFIMILKDFIGFRLIPQTALAEWGSYVLEKRV